MRHQGDGAHRAMGAQPRQRVARRGHGEAEPVHAGVEFEQDIVARVGRRLVEHAQLLFAMHHDRQIATRRNRQFDSLEQSFEQHQPFRVTRFAQADRRIDFNQAETVGIRQRRQDAFETVAVGVGLDHRQHARAGGMRARDAEIVAQRGGIDGGGQRTHWWQDWSTEGLDSAGTRGGRNGSRRLTRSHSACYSTTIPLRSHGPSAAAAEAAPIRSMV